MTPERRLRHERGIALLESYCTGGRVRTQTRSTVERLFDRELAGLPMKDRLARRLGFDRPEARQGGRRGA